MNCGRKICDIRYLKCDENTIKHYANAIKSKTNVSNYLIPELGSVGLVVKSCKTRLSYKVVMGYLCGLSGMCGMGGLGGILVIGGMGELNVLGGLGDLGGLGCLGVTDGWGIGVQKCKKA